MYNVLYTIDFLHFSIWQTEPQTDYSLEISNLALAQTNCIRLEIKYQDAASDGEV